MCRAHSARVRPWSFLLRMGMEGFQPVLDEGAIRSGALAIAAYAGGVTALTRPLIALPACFSVVVLVVQQWPERQGTS